MFAARHIRLLLLLAPLALSACSGLSGDGTEGEASVRKTVTFVAQPPVTRAAVTAHEDDVLSLDLFVFKQSGGYLDALSHVEGSTSVSATVSAGEPLHWWVIANAPAGVLGTPETESALLSGVTTLLHSTSASLVMFSSGSVTVDADGTSVPAALDRYASKVSLGSVSAPFIGTFAAGKTFIIDAVYLINVVGSTPWSGSPAAGSLWYNRTEHEAGNPALVEDMTFKAVTGANTWTSTGGAVSSPSGWQGVSLYAMPNPVDNGVDSRLTPSWSPRNTRLVIETRIDGEKNYYPVTLPAMECNTHYILNNLIINGYGSDDPDKPVTRDEITFTITITPWGTASHSVVFPRGE